MKNKRYRVRSSLWTSEVYVEPGPHADIEAYAKACARHGFVAYANCHIHALADDEV